MNIVNQIKYINNALNTLKLKSQKNAQMREAVINLQLQLITINKSNFNFNQISLLIFSNDALENLNFCNSENFINYVELFNIQHMMLTLNVDTITPTNWVPTKFLKEIELEFELIQKNNLDESELSAINVLRLKLNKIIANKSKYDFKNSRDNISIDLFNTGPRVLSVLRSGFCDIMSTHKRKKTKDSIVKIQEIILKFVTVAQELKVRTNCSYSFRMVLQHMQVAYDKYQHDDYVIYRFMDESSIKLYKDEITIVD